MLRVFIDLHGTTDQTNLRHKLLVTFLYQALAVAVGIPIREPSQFCEILLPDYSKLSELSFQ